MNDLRQYYILKIEYLRRQSKMLDKMTEKFDEKKLKQEKEKKNTGG